MRLRQLFDKEFSTYKYLLASAKGRETLVVDPVKEQAPIYLDLIEQLDLKLVRAITSPTNRS